MNEVEMIDLQSQTSRKACVEELSDTVERLLNWPDDELPKPLKGMIKAEFTDLALDNFKCGLSDAVWREDLPRWSRWLNYGKQITRILQQCKEQTIPKQQLDDKFKEMTRGSSLGKEEANILKRSLEESLATGLFKNRLIFAWLYLQHQAAQASLLDATPENLQVADAIEILSYSATDADEDVALQWIVDNATKLQQRMQHTTFVTAGAKISLDLLRWILQARELPASLHAEVLQAGLQLAQQRTRLAELDSIITNSAAMQSIQRLQEEINQLLERRKREGTGAIDNELFSKKVKCMVTTINRLVNKLQQINYPSQEIDDRPEWLSSSDQLRASISVQVAILNQQQRKQLFAQAKTLALDKQGGAGIAASAIGRENNNSIDEQTAYQQCISAPLLTAQMAMLKRALAQHAGQQQNITLLIDADSADAAAIKAGALQLATDYKSPQGSRIQIITTEEFIKAVSNCQEQQVPAEAVILLTALPPKQLAAFTQYCVTSTQSSQIEWLLKEDDPNIPTRVQEQLESVRTNTDTDEVALDFDSTKWGLYDHSHRRSLLGVAKQLEQMLPPTKDHVVTEYAAKRQRWLSTSKQRKQNQYYLEYYTADDDFTYLDINRQQWLVAQSCNQVLNYCRSPERTAEDLQILQEIKEGFIEDDDDDELMGLDSEYRPNDDRTVMILAKCRTLNANSSFRAALLLLNKALITEVFSENPLVAFLQRKRWLGFAPTRLFTSTDVARLFNSEHLRVTAEQKGQQFVESQQPFNSSVTLNR